jgi:hypothetical protein
MYPDLIAPVCFIVFATLFNVYLNLPYSNMNRCIAVPPPKERNNKRGFNET